MPSLCDSSVAPVFWLGQGFVGRVEYAGCLLDRIAGRRLLGERHAHRTEGRKLRHTTPKALLCELLQQSGLQRNRLHVEARSCHRIHCFEHQLRFSGVTRDLAGAAEDHELLGSVGLALPAFLQQLLGQGDLGDLVLCLPSL